MQIQPLSPEADIPFRVPAYRTSKPPFIIIIIIITE